MVWRNVLGKSTHLKRWLSKHLTFYIPRVLKIHIFFSFTAKEIGYTVVIYPLFFLKSRFYNYYNI